jgi:hypothetical protein
MTSPARFIALAAAAARTIAGSPEGCLKIPGIAAGDVAFPDAACLRLERHGCPGRGRARQTIPARVVVVLASAARAAGLLPGHPGRGPVPAAKASRLRPAVTAPSPAAAAQVIAACTAFFPLLAAAGPEPQVRAAALLAPYAAQPCLGHVLAQMAWFRARGLVSWGTLIPHVTSVQVTGSQAFARDCQDAGSAWLVSTVTGEVIRGTAGSARTALAATLARGGGERWRLTLLAHAAGPMCMQDSRRSSAAGRNGIQRPAPVPQVSRRYQGGGTG